VHPIQELKTLEDFVNENKSVVALTPDVLRMEKSQDANGWLKVKLSLADTMEYGHVLITAVLAHPEFANSHPRFVNGFVKALQRSLVHATAMDPQVVEYAREAFNQQPSLVKRALKTANSAQVWASTAAVTEDLWTRAVEAHYDSLGKTWDGVAKAEAQQMFAESFKPHVDRAQQAALELLQDPGKQSRRPQTPTGIITLVIGITIGVSTILAAWKSVVWQLPLAAAIVSAPFAFRLHRKGPLVLNHSLLLIAFCVIWIFHWKMQWASDEAFASISTILIIEFLLVIAHQYGKR
jgi:hypothetical protein